MFRKYYEASVVRYLRMKHFCSSGLSLQNLYRFLMNTQALKKFRNIVLKPHRITLIRKAAFKLSKETPKTANPIVKHVFVFESYRHVRTK